MTFLSPVHLNDVFRVNGKVLVWIYDYTEESRVGLQEEKKLFIIFLIHNQEIFFSGKNSIELET